MSKNKLWQYILLAILTAGAFNCWYLAYQKPEHQHKEGLLKTSDQKGGPAVPEENDGQEKSLPEEAKAQMQDQQEINQDQENRQQADNQEHSLVKQHDALETARRGKDTLPGGESTDRRESERISHGPSVDQEPQGNPQLTHEKAKTANPIPTDEEIQSRLNQENQNRKTVEAALQDRQRQIDEVHRAVVHEMELDPFSEPKPFVEPELKVPDEVAQKIKSKELVAH